MPPTGPGTTLSQGPLCEIAEKSLQNQKSLNMKIYKDHKLNHVIGVGRENALEEFLNGTYKNVNHKRKNSYSSNSEDAVTWSCFDMISQLPDLKKK